MLLRHRRRQAWCHPRVAQTAASGTGPSARMGSGADRNASC